MTSQLPPKLYFRIGEVAGLVGVEPEFWFMERAGIGFHKNDNAFGGWAAKQIHQAVCTTFQFSANAYGLNQLRYDLRKLKGHGLLARDGSRYAYQLTAKGVTALRDELTLLQKLANTGLKRLAAA